MTSGRWIGYGGALVILVAAWQGIGSAVTPEPIPAAAPGAAARRLNLAPQGVGSCAATACHGSVLPAAPDWYPSRVLRNEYTIWANQDPHANAYQVLHSERSQGIERRLTGGKESAAHRDARCLACHATPGAELAGTSAEVVRQEGVGCESCHGAAQRWLGAHTQYGWNSLGPRQKEEQFGMRPTKELAARAAVCVDCHVGSAGRDVNHDLIAAGHPRLNFEFAAYLANMPPHWVDDTRGSYPARVWAIGQAATAQAAAALLADRARRAERAQSQHAAARWPEFSEYDCFACHHDLADEKWRKSRAASGAMPGTPAWGTWPYPMALTLAEAGDPAAFRTLDGRFKSLRTEMGRFAAEPGKVAQEADALTADLARWLQTLPEETNGYDAGKLKVLLGTIDATGPRASALGWDGQAQRYLAMQPLRLALKSLDPTWDDRTLHAELNQLFQALQFPSGFDSPRRFDPARPGDRR
jgi:hypothetical protein